jgi:hypothetical protein
MTYQEKLIQAIEFAKKRIAQGVDYYNATEEANEEFGVSLCDIQEAIAFS